MGSIPPDGGVDGGSDGIVKSGLIVGSVEASEGGLNLFEQLSAGSVEVSLGVGNDVGNGGVGNSLGPEEIEGHMGSGGVVIVAVTHFSGGGDVVIEEKGVFESTDCVFPGQSG